MFNGQSKRSQFKSHALGSTISSPLTTFNDLDCINKNNGNPVGNLNRREALNAHKFATTNHFNSQKEPKGKGGTIKDFAIDYRKNIVENRYAIKKLLELRNMMSRQAIAFRGHRDSGRLNFDELNTNEGNWRELVKLIAKGCPTLLEFVKNSPLNTTYLSHESQKKLLKVSAENKVDQILKNIRIA